MSFRRAAILGTVICLLTAAGVPAQDTDHATSAGALKIVHAWTRAASAGSDALVFMEIENAGPPDRLIGGASEIAPEAEIVGLTIGGGDISVSPVGPVEVPSGRLELDPGGLALALKGLRHGLAIGDELELALTFETAGDVSIHVEVEPGDAKRHGHAGHAH